MLPKNMQSVEAWLIANSHSLSASEMQIKEDIWKDVVTSKENFTWRWISIMSGTLMAVFLILGAMLFFYPITKPVKVLSYHGGISINGQPVHVAKDITAISSFTVAEDASDYIDLIFSDGHIVRFKSGT
jgi:hypothetical protein